MRRKEHSRSPNRGHAKRRHLQPDALVKSLVLKLRRACLDAPVPEIYIEPFGFEPLGTSQSRNNTSLDAPDPPKKPLMTMASEFLN
ncbi:hypothetical protein BGZ89_000531, partial [Linnemannia elongata]